MANEIMKEIKTRIALKYNTYAYWTTGEGKDYAPLKGEVCFCAIESKDQGAQTAPTVLFKVGVDGTKKFSELKWASALAADVYEWAKASGLYVASASGSGNAITSVSWDSTLNNNKGGLKVEKGTTFATKAELDAAIEAFGGDLSAITDNDHRYEFSIPTTGANAGKLQVVATNYVNGKADTSTTTAYDFVTPDELTTILGSYYTKSEIDTKLAGYQPKGNYQPAGNYKTTQTAVTDKGLTGAKVLEELSQNANGEISYTTRSLTPADIGAQPAGNYKTTQTAVSDPTASGKSLTFIDTISQNANGVISATKKNVNLDAYALKTDIPTIPSITITDDASVEAPTTDTVNVYKNLIASGHTLTEELVSVPTKAYVDKVVAGAVDYLGTVTALTGLSTSAGKGDFYRVSTAFGSCHAGDLIVAEKDKPAQLIDGTNWSCIHGEEGDITEIIAGNGLTGGGSVGSVTINVGAGNGISVAADAVSVKGYNGINVDSNGVGVKAGNGITVDANGVHHADTSSVTNVTKAARTYISGITFDTYGHVTAVETGSETVTDTHHQAKNVIGASATAKANAAVAATTNSIYLNLVENDTVRSSHNIVGTGATNVSSDANGKITIKSTDTWNALSASQDGYVSKDWYAPLSDFTSRWVKDPDWTSMGYFMKDSFSVRGTATEEDPWGIYEYATLTPGELKVSVGDDSYYQSTTYAHRAIRQDINSTEYSIALPEYAGLMAVIDKNGNLGGDYDQELKHLMFGYDNYWAEIGNIDGSGYLTVSDADSSNAATISTTYGNGFIDCHGYIELKITYPASSLITGSAEMAVIQNGTIANELNYIQFGLGENGESSGSTYTYINDLGIHLWSGAAQDHLKISANGFITHTADVYGDGGEHTCNVTLPHVSGELVVSGSTEIVYVLDCN